MIRLWIGIIVFQVITHRQQKIGIAVVVEIVHDEAGTPYVEIDREVNPSRVKPSPAAILETPHFLLFLRNNGSDIEVAVAVVIGQRNVNRADRRQ